MFGLDHPLFWSARHVKIACLAINHMNARHFRGHLAFHIKSVIDNLQPPSIE